MAGIANTRKFITIYMLYDIQSLNFNIFAVKNSIRLWRRMWWCEWEMSPKGSGIWAIGPSWWHCSERSQEVQPCWRKYVTETRLLSLLIWSLLPPCHGRCELSASCHHGSPTLSHYDRLLHLWIVSQSKPFPLQAVLVMVFYPATEK